MAKKKIVKKIRIFSEKDGFYSIKKDKIYNCATCPTKLTLMPPCPGCGKEVKNFIDPPIFEEIEIYLKKTTKNIIALVYDPVLNQVLFKKITSKSLKGEGD